MNRRHFATVAQRDAALARAADRAGGAGPGPLAPSGPSRRQFLQGGLAAGMAAGLPLLLTTACSSGDDDDARAPAGKVSRTLFFDLSHLAHQGRPYRLEAGGRTYTMTPVAEKPTVLATARTTNKFLAAVPDRHVTHHVEEVLHDAQNVTFAYVTGVLDPNQPTAPTWTMVAIYVLIPETASVAAYAHASGRLKSATTALSHKRRQHGLQAAASAQDLADEGALLDPYDHAAALISFNPNIMALDGNAAHAVKTSYIASAQATQDCHDAIVYYGDAKPQGLDGGNPGWATLMPVKKDNGQQATIVNGPDKGRLQYAPIYHPDVAAAIGESNREL